MPRLTNISGFSEGYSAIPKANISGYSEGYSSIPKANITSYSEGYTAIPDANVTDALTINTTVTIETSEEYIVKDDKKIKFGNDIDVCIYWDSGSSALKITNSC